MSLRKRANYVIGAIVIGGAVILGGLHFFAEHGQFTPASTTNGATNSDQRDPLIDANSGQPATGGRPVSRP